MLSLIGNQVHFHQPLSDRDHDVLMRLVIGHVTWHTLRHTFCSWAAMEGLSLKVIQILAGHKTITMAARYSHLAPDTTVEASERIVRPTSA